MPEPAVQYRLPAATFDRADEPIIPVEALESEAAAEAYDTEYQRWARTVARTLDAACRTARDTVTPALICRPARTEWNAPEIEGN